MHLVDDPPPCSWPPEGQITLALLSERLGKRLSKEALQKLVAAMGFTVGTAPDGSRVKL
jgi:phenylalanyl-tRNA synthetase beta subunit